MAEIYSEDSIAGKTEEPESFGYQDYMAEYVESLPRPTPAEIAAGIRNAGYIGQETAVKAVSLFAYRHLERLRSIFIRKMDPAELPAKGTMLMVGPTGCGKTYLVELAFRFILGLPTAVVDMTTFSETGYVGQDVSTLLTRLLYAADMNPAAAAVGIICMDEFDKLSGGSNRAVFSGGGTTKDVSGMGVQRELLKLLENTTVPVPEDITHSEYARRRMIPTDNIAFLACGAFSGFKGVIDRERGRTIGFDKKIDGRPGSIAVDYQQDELEMVRNFQTYGFMPELIGRFRRIVPFSSLTQEELMEIVRGRIAKNWQREFSLEGIELLIEDDVLHAMVQKARERETGARAIDSVLDRYLEDAAFQAYSQTGVEWIRLYLQNGSAAKTDAEISFEIG
ncbi:MAG: AAA family ATPase [Spirochaetales bacterium]|nr:AAA family ATPase [Spirochaetales bacterium]MCF7937167.1 AAA family ATPase [Spirochaetales bacterium]